MKTKLLFLLLAGIFLSLNSFSQITGKQSVQNPGILNSISGVNGTHERAGNYTGPQTPASINKRLVGISYSIWENDAWEYYDSTYITYSGDRGGTYFGDANYDEYITMTWNQNEFVNSLRILQTFDENTRKVTTNSENWSGVDWVHTSEVKYTYDEQGNTINFWYSLVGNAPLQDVYTYNSSNQVLTELRQYWIDNQWQNDNYYEYSYDAAGNMILRSYYKWNVFANEWEIQGSEELVYDNSGNQIEYTKYNYFDGEKFPSLKELSTYNSNNNTVTSTHLKYTDETWVNDYRTLYTYPNGSPYYDSYTNQDWEDGFWVDNYRVFYTYDTKNEYYSLIASDKWDSISWVHIDKDEYFFNSFGLITKREKFNWENGGFVNDNLVYCYYEDYEDGANAVKENSKQLPLALLANPVSNQLTFIGNMAKPEDIVVKIYNTQGQVVYWLNTHFEAGQLNFSVSVSHLPAGTYIYSLQSKDASVQGKFIKQ